jgi:hypothetical protein
MFALTLAKKILIAGGTTLFALGTINMISPAQAASLNLSYIPGQAWRWIIFGDARGEADSEGNYVSTSILPNWVGDFSKSSPWIASFGNTGGYHNGPTLWGNPGNSVLAWWTPSDVNDYLYWSGKSTAKVQQGELLFSTLDALNGATQATFKVANQVDSFAVPEPLTIFGSILGLGVLGAVKRKRKQQ